MQISSISSGSSAAVQANDGFAKFKQSFKDLGAALESGNLSDAKEALAKLQKNAPAKASNDKNPMSEKMDALSQAVDSGDIQAAQEAYADIKKAMKQRPSGGGAGGPPPGGAPPAGGGGGKASSASSSSNSNKTYDVKDTNKDGAVSWKEEQDYKLKHPDQAKTATDTAKVDSDRGVIDALA